MLDKDNQNRFFALDEIFSTSRDELADEFSDYFVKYHRRLISERGYLKCALDYVEWWSNLLDIKGKNILDVGCGFGTYTLMFSFFGASQVFGADHNKEKIDLFIKLLQKIKPEIENVTPSLQDGLTLNFDNEHFQAIFIKDVISHVRDLSSFLDEMSRLLKTGGRILITDENNALEWAGKKERMKKWLAWEEKGVKKEELRAGEPQLTYLEMRREDISKLLQDNNSADANNQNLIDKLARMTKGLWGDELAKGVNQILETGELKYQPEFPYRHPRTGEFMEREFNPFKLAEQMGKHGIDARVVPARFFTQKPVLNLAGKVITSLHPTSIYFQPNFYILGVKK